MNRIHLVGALAASLVLANAAGEAPAQDAAGKSPPAEPDPPEVDLRSQARARRLREGTRGAWAVSADGALVAAGTPDGKIELWRSDERRPHRILEGHGDLVSDLEFEPDGRGLWSVGDDGSARCWDLADGKQRSVHRPEDVRPLGPLNSVKSGYHAVALSADGRFVVLLSALQVDVRDRKDAKWLTDPRFHTGGFKALLFADSRTLLIHTFDEIEAHDLIRPGALQRSPFGDELSEPSWRLVQTPLTPELPAESNELGDGYGFIEVGVLDDDGATRTVATLITEYRDDSFTKSTLTAWDPGTGQRYWSKRIPQEFAVLEPARRSRFLVVISPEKLELRSPRDGFLFRTIPLDAKTKRPAVLAPDASFGYEADRDGNLIRIPILAPAAPPKPAPTPVPAPPAPPAPGTGK